MFYELPASREGKVLKILFRKRKSTVLGKGRKIWISTLIPACIVCMAFIAGPHRYLLKYYYFNKHNVDAREAALNDVNRKYNQEFELIATDFEREKYGHREWFGAESVYDRAIYRQRWIFTMQDSEGRQFYTYLVRGSAFWIDGDEMFFFRGKSVADDLKKESKEITETYVYEYILQKLEDALKLSGKGIQKS